MILVPRRIEEKWEEDAPQEIGASIQSEGSQAALIMANEQPAHFVGGRTGKIGLRDEGEVLHDSGGAQ